MALIAQQLAENMKAHLLKANEHKQEDVSVAIDMHCRQLEQEVYAAIRSITITIPPGAIMVQTAMGPAANIAPIVLTSTVK
ncbi:hypothetical protein [Chitinophaga arvensicola]|uniref:Uncharacterized protein n=1 Tax=Chitinophaga arvensicola TaxID=29529 RepID=A0A1I0R9G1_9BACT|nr:hypothetical protein [Chitinophaga arvensicola]SEW37460.1 hypothetical protein SAMN04488122_2510 [Chitinophaga arvensicola]